MKIYLNVIFILLVINLETFQAFRFNHQKTLIRTSYLPRFTQISDSISKESNSLAYEVPEVIQHPLQSNDNLDLSLPLQRINKFIIEIAKKLLEIFYGNRHYARFAALETIARVPYFSYTSVLHFYETLGWFRRKEFLKVHFAESWNEMHHLLIMESLGGSEKAADRIFAKNLAIIYFWFVVLLYFINPAMAYDLNKHVEIHAYHSYNEFLISYEKELKELPAPQIALEYYGNNDKYMYDAFHLKTITKSNETITTPQIKNLYDVFYYIREDEAEHAKTMKYLQREASKKQNFLK